MLYALVRLYLISILALLQSWKLRILPGLYGKWARLGAVFREQAFGAPAIAFLIASPAEAQHHYQTDFTAEDLRQRRAAVGPWTTN